MANSRRFQLDELILRPGTYFNPQTEIMLVVDDSPEVDHELFEGVDGAEWVLISDEMPLDEHRRDDMVERFQLAQQEGPDPDDEDDLGDDEDDDLDGDLDDEDEDLEAEDEE